MPIDARHSLPLLMAACLSAACDGAPADVGCAPAAVSIEVDGQAYCAHHDVARFTCPADLPHRQVFEGVAFCGAGPLDDTEARTVAYTALRTGAVLEQRTVTDFAVPAEWQSTPGAPADIALEMPVSTWIPSNVSRASTDGDPFLCTRRFERFEVEPDGPGLWRITAWDRLTCGADQLGHGAEIRETFDVALPPLDPGVHRLYSVGAYQRADPAAVVVGLDVVCAEPRPLDACFRGALFAECGPAVEINPAIWCDRGAPERCVWAACPPADHVARACDGEPQCPVTSLGWGTAPWDRTRAMALDVIVDPALIVERPALECASAEPAEHARVCEVVGDAWQIERNPGDDPSWGWPSMLSRFVIPENGRIGSGWALSVEVDLFAEPDPRARICLVPYSDADLSAEAVCAVAGTLTLDVRPETAEQTGAVQMHVRAVFPDFERSAFCGADCTVRDLVVEARF